MRQGRSVSLAGVLTKAGTLSTIQIAILILIVLLSGNILVGNWICNASDADFGVESTRTAAALLRTGSFRDPFVVMPTGLSSHVAPAYPVLYAAVVWTFGTGKATWWAIRVITLGAYSLQLALLPLLAVELGIARQIGIVGTAIGCVVAIPGSSYKWEAMFTGLALVIVAYLTVALKRSRNVLGLATALGVVWGVGFLISPTLLA